MANMDSVLYNVSLPFLFTRVITHRLRINPEKSATLLIYDTLSDEDDLESKDQYKRAGLDLNYFLKSGIFDKVLLMNSSIRFADCSQSAEEIERKIMKEYNYFFDEESIDLRSFSEIYTCGDWWEGNFKIYCSLSGIQVHVIEDFKDSFFGFKSHAPVTTYEQLLVKRSGNYPDGVTDIPVLSSQSVFSPQIYSNKKYEIFDFFSEKNNLEKSQIEQIKTFYNHYSVKIPESCKLIVLNNVRYNRKDFLASSHKKRIKSLLDTIDDGKDSWESAVTLSVFRTRVALDFFGRELKHTHFKHHPRSWFDNDYVREQFDSKSSSLSPLPIDYYDPPQVKYDLAIHFASSASESLEVFSDYNIYLGEDYYSVYIDYYKLFATLSFILESSESPLVISSGPYISQIKLLLEYFFHNKAVVVKEFNPEMMLEDSANTFLIVQNYEKRFECFANAFFFEEIETDIRLGFLQALKIEKKSLALGWQLEENEIVFSIIKNDKIFDKFKKFRLTKSFYYTRVEINVSAENTAEILNSYQHLILDVERFEYDKTRKLSKELAEKLDFEKALTRELVGKLDFEKALTHELVEKLNFEKILASNRLDELKTQKEYIESIFSSWSYRIGSSILSPIRFVYSIINRK